jgi:hypothetical protein
MVFQPAECFGFDVEIGSYIFLGNAPQQIALLLDKLNKPLLYIEADMVLLPLLFLQVKTGYDKPAEPLHFRHFLIEVIERLF